MAIEDAGGVLANIQGRKLDIGCGSTKIAAEYVGVDHAVAPGVDLVGDVYEVLSAIPDGSLGGVYCAHFFEHVDDVSMLLDELARTLRTGALLEVIVPHFANPYFYSDPTHKSTFGLYSFAYLASDAIHRRQVPAYSRNPNFELRSSRLRFKSPRPFYVRYALKRSIEVFVNVNRWTQEFYEENLCYFIPCYEVRFVLERVEEAASQAGATRGTHG